MLGTLYLHPRYGYILATPNGGTLIVKPYPGPELHPIALADIGNCGSPQRGGSKSER